MYSLNRMGFNKPLCNTRQYGSGTTFNLTQTQNNMVLLKPEYLGNDRFKFLNNFGFQPHLVSDKQFADINSIKPPVRKFYPSSYTSPVEKFKTPQTVIPLPDSKISKSPGQVEVQPQLEIAVDNTMQKPHKCKSSKVPKEKKSKACTRSDSTTGGIMTNKYCKSSKLLKKGRQKRKQTKQGISMPCDKPSRKIKNANKPWHKTSLKLQILEITDIPSENNMESPLPTVQCEAEHIILPVNIVDRVESCNTQNVSPSTSPSFIKIQKPNSCHRFRVPSECESEDSFIVFDDSSNNFDSDIFELDEFCYSSSTEDDDDEEVCSIVSSLEDVWPAKRVRFADDKDLCEVHPMIQWSFAYQKARKGPWERLALDRTRFQRRIANLESTLNIVLQPEHRSKIYHERFTEGSM